MYDACFKHVVNKINGYNLSHHTNLVTSRLKEHT